ncbi:unnamed protein product [Tilletia controversa]|nr:unnamed protein product [Tilletia controversa]
MAARTAFSSAARALPRSSGSTASSGQRFLSTNASAPAASPATRAAAAASTAVAVGTMAWYAHLYGNPLAGLLPSASANSAADEGLREYLSSNTIAVSRFE